MPIIVMELFTLQLSTKVKSMNGNQSKGNEKQLESEPNQKLSIDANERLNLNANAIKQRFKSSNIRADGRLFALNNTLKNMIRT